MASGDDAASRDAVERLVREPGEQVRVEYRRLVHGIGERGFARALAERVLSAVPRVRDVPGAHGKGPAARRTQTPRRLAGEPERDAG